MKKNILFLVIFASFLSSNAAPVPILYTTRSNKCFIGCSDVDDKTVPHSQILEDGSTYTYASRHIKCTGIGFKSCPSQAYQSEGGNTLDAFDIFNTDQLLTYAISKIEVESIYQGTHSIQVYNTSTLKTYIYTITWSSLNNGEEQSFQINRGEI
jgi:hypothetical protein